MGIGKKIIDFIAPETDSVPEQPVVTSSNYEKPKGKGMNIESSTKMVLFEPRTFEEAIEIGHNIVAGRTCIVNFHRLKKELAQRTIDFLSGVIFPTEGSVQQIDKDVYLCSPFADVAGEIDLDSVD